MSPIIFRQDPMRLLWEDLKLSFTLLPFLSSLLRPFDSKDPRAELNFMNFGNVLTMLLHSGLFICTLMSIVGAIVMAFLPVPLLIFALYVCAVVIVGAFCEMSLSDLLTHSCRSLELWS
jgi:hypothetical protein